MDRRYDRPDTLRVRSDTHPKSKMSVDLPEKEGFDFFPEDILV
jgi:hypothetical protein